MTSGQQTMRWKLLIVPDCAKVDFNIYWLNRFICLSFAWNRRRLTCNLLEVTKTIVVLRDFFVVGISLKSWESFFHFHVIIWWIHDEQRNDNRRFFVLICLDLPDFKIDICNWNVFISDVECIKKHWTSHTGKPDSCTKSNFVGISQVTSVRAVYPCVTFVTLSVNGNGIISGWPLVLIFTSMYFLYWFSKYAANVLINCLFLAMYW